MYGMNQMAYFFDVVLPQSLNYFMQGPHDLYDVGTFTLSNVPGVRKPIKIAI